MLRAVPFLMLALFLLSGEVVAASNWSEAYSRRSYQLGITLSGAATPLW